MLNEERIDSSVFIERETVRRHSKERSCASLERSIIMQPERGGGIQNTSEHCRESVHTGESMVDISFGVAPAGKATASVMGLVTD